MQNYITRIITEIIGDTVGAGTDVTGVVLDYLDADYAISYPELAALGY